MKTRKCCLPLVILAALLCGSPLSAQQLAHTELFGYFEKIPSGPAFPDDAILSSAEPNSFEDYTDLNALQKKLQDVTKPSGVNEFQINSISEPMMNIASDKEGEKLTMKRTLDSLEAALKDMQAVKIEFNANFKRLVTLYDKNLDAVNKTAADRQRTEPCNGNIECLQKQVSALNKDIIEITKKRVLNEEYLLSVYQTQAKPSFKRIDHLLESANYGERATNSEARNLLRGAQQNLIMFLTEIIEYKKLEHITISNCARLAHQGYHGK